MSTQQHTLCRNFLRSHQHGEILSVLHGIHHGLEINGISRTILEPHHLRITGNTLNSSRSKFTFVCDGILYKKIGNGN